MNECQVCETETPDPICPTCRGIIRDHLHELLRLEPYLETIALLHGYRGEKEGGLPLGGEAMVMLGPISLTASDGPGSTPTAVLLRWELEVRQALGHQPPPRASFANAADYLHANLHQLLTPRGDGFPWRVLAESLTRTRARMEDVLHEGLRDQGGVPCPTCRVTLIRHCHPGRGLSDEWRCPACGLALVEADYYGMVQLAYRANAPALTAEDLGAELGVPPSRIRVWGSKGYVLKRGRDQAGRVLYDAPQVRARVEEAG